MNNKSLLTWLYTFIVSCIVMSSCKVQDINFRGVKNYQFVDGSTESVSMNVIFSVDNPSAFNIRVKPSHLNLYLDNKMVGEIKFDEKVKIRKRTDKEYSVPVTAFFDKGLPLGTLMKGRVTAKIDGNIKAKIFIVGKKYAVEESMKIKLSDFF